MQTNIIKMTPDEVDPAEYKRELILSLISARRAARRAINQIDEVGARNRAERRLARKSRESGNPLLVRNAEVIEARIAERKSERDTWDELLMLIGANIWALADDIDRIIPTRELLDILEVNPVDRSRVGNKPCFREIVFVHGLEDSATNRYSETKEGPLFRALLSYTMHAMDSNPGLQQKMIGSLFGKGGMFEFVPSYSQTPSGHFERNPPKLRLADEVDLPANRVH